jgi:tryptophanase
MMTSDNELDYLAVRVAQARRLADGTEDPGARMAHLAMAKAYTATIAAARQMPAPKMPECRGPAEI